MKKLAMTLMLAAGLVFTAAPAQAVTIERCTAWNRYCQYVPTWNDCHKHKPNLKGKELADYRKWCHSTKTHGK